MNLLHQSRHDRNGLENYRAITALLAITGNFDRIGGQILTPHTYMHVACGFPTREEEYLYETKPKNTKLPIGAGRFPLWDYLEGEMQSMDLSRQILEGTPYPVKGSICTWVKCKNVPGI